MKNKLLVLLTLITCTKIIPRGFGGGFATGALVGTGITLAATSNRGDRSPEYYDYKRDQRSRSEINRQIRDEERQLKKSERDLNRTSDQDRINEINDDIKMHKQNIKDLREDLRNLR